MEGEKESRMHQPCIEDSPIVITPSSNRHRTVALLDRNLGYKNQNASAIYNDDQLSCLHSSCIFYTLAQVVRGPLATTAHKAHQIGPVALEQWLRELYWLIIITLAQYHDVA